VGYEGQKNIMYVIAMLLATASRVYISENEKIGLMIVLHIKKLIAQ
jgi:hypothetical protein